MYKSFAGAAWADWLFMIGLAAIGTALILGIGMRLAAAAGGLLLVLMFTAVLPPENNPFMDDHLIYAGVLALLALTAAGNTLGLGTQWTKLPIVQRLPWLK
jgi:thiosulfate dehydrogenase [quinone] large subunit